MSTKLIFATNNQHKVDEMRVAVGPIFQITSLKEAGIHQEIPEPFDTLEENAYEKSRVIHELTGLSCFSEDTGLEVKALNGAPGVKSARYAGENPKPGANIEKLLRQLEGHSDRSARFRTVISLLLGTEHFLFEGICEGRILPAEKGDSGFGYDPIFVPDGSALSFGQMNLEEKNKYSHRRKAADMLVAFLQQRMTSAVIDQNF